MNTQVSVGPSSIIGYGLTLIGAVLTAVLGVEGGEHFISPELVAILTTVAGVTTNLGRQYQAAQVPAPSVVEEAAWAPPIPAEAEQSVPPAV